MLGNLCHSFHTIEAQKTSTNEEKQCQGRIATARVQRSEALGMWKAILCFKILEERAPER